jgi:hypothetical protein
MIILLIALGGGLLVAILSGILISPVAGILPGLVVSALVYFLLMRRANAQLQAAMGQVQATLQRKDIDGGIAQLLAMKKQFGKQVLFMESQLDGQIGAIYFMKKDFEKARPYLDNAFVRSWDAKMMLAVLMAKQKDGLKAMDDMLEKVVRFAPKQGMLWSVWAYLHWKAGDDKRAIELLGRGKAILGEGDAVLTQNLLSLQNDKKMKMKGYGDAWYALHLEVHPMVMQQQRGGNMRFARR